MKRKLHFLVIDPQNDFCDLPAHYLPQLLESQHTVTTPALPVSGAHADMLRIANLINQGIGGLTNISVTLDSHHRLDIAHPRFWIDREIQAPEQTPKPFTQITAADVRSGKFMPRNRAALPRVLAYLDALASAGRYQLMVWPVHCEIGSWGHNVHVDVRTAYNRWEDAALGIVDKITKGTNPWTEHYSAIMAEVPDVNDPNTQLNRGLIEQLGQADQIYIAGEASSHCVKATTEHLVDHLESSQVSRLVLLSDCMSPVTGFDAQHQCFMQDMAARGVQIALAADVLPDLIANHSR